MSEPLKLPDDPTVKDVAHGLVQVHECLDAARAEIHNVSTALVVIQGQNALMWPAFKFMADFSSAMQKFGTFVGGAVIVAFITAFATLFIQNQVNHDAVTKAANEAAANAHVAATASTHVVKQLNSLGAEP